MIVAIVKNSLLNEMNPSLSQLQICLMKLCWSVCSWQIYVSLETIGLIFSNVLLFYHSFPTQEK